MVRQDQVRSTYLSKDEPAGTRAQVLEYWDGDLRVAVVFQYLRPNGTLGGSGKPDPKLVRRDGVDYVLAISQA